MISVPLLGLLTSACVILDRHMYPGYSLAQMLQALPSIRTGADLIARFSAPSGREVVSPDQPHKYGMPPNLLSREYFEAIGVATPDDLVDKLEVGMTILYYLFEYGEAYVPGMPSVDVGQFFVFVDKSDLILGWIASKDLIGNEERTRARR
jgi:hypothetical protein